MTPTPARSRRAAGRPLKSPLAVASGYAGSAPRGAAEASFAVEGIALTERQATIAEFEDFLRTTNNRDGRPYEDGSINAYVSPPKNLDAWLTANGIDGDFTVADTATLNRYFREYYLRSRLGIRELHRTSSGTRSATTGKWAELHWTQHSPRSVITMS
jgi:hypothetical protein